MVKAKLVVLPGDGIGPEVTAPAVEVLKEVAAARGHEFEFEYRDFGGISIDNHGEPLTNDTLETCRAADAVLLGAVGGPKWASNDIRPEQGLLKIRKELGLFANVRPCMLVSPEFSMKASPIREEYLKGTDFIVIRELTGGIYFGDRTEAGEDGRAVDTMVYTVPEIERIARCAGKIAMGRRKKLTSVDKANVLACSRLWRKTVTRVITEEFPEIELDHQYVDSAAMHMIRRPTMYDVIVTGNMFGDILTDEASMLPGSLGLLPSASMTETGWGLYEPIHGSAPDIAGQGLANPIGTILSAAMLLRQSLALGDEADLVERACSKALADGHRTKDIQGEQPKSISTGELAAEVLKNVKAFLSA
eukprot:m.444754 g.444754  ORF g.444754 m.444754 type:complete len:362 (+) comp19141_c0_seq1:40-1125(+)